ncbi:nodulation protein NopA [Mesorhizobium sp. VK25A]|uniref:Nodulation protein NopA n=5 Tax=Mesorhizobium TaxID=68287 RepID=A0ABU5AEV7_9HYPH|nr:MULTISPECIES: nodulation protein NopA [unclassified Mesorhizobium]MDX8450824.1 nodulation protein NopA [Mesorhizobium sp. VK3C]MDX8463535.1 nodulation protein NopA [Mesorhizobium sp. VK2D]MDX8470385.1 nodulation protein NopA [Mesorhizobium sp. VK23B]MDX8476768.1 nodulation protein NopA [Mesorhizobium sp. VK23A]MDX8489799.1 nodulation protein NopA [Mesorhizobium sp. VK2B]
MSKVAPPAGGGAAPAIGNMAAEGAGTAAFQSQIAALTAMSAEATERSVMLRTVTTNLQSIKKVADERVQ